ncbi:hypothetical protein K490DRAFT_64540 [Saccharata proteae CBS 121410]|uniref:SET domain-containing protein n=1 Tax=Saccharata proteae CBS 121410 TaxID=1314787 RepID=A0A9P4I0A2_9PEZI|nr:hypothetical protein K490DRAFT_64540 [Saccharata proteae CBS 121410]
MAPGRAGLPKGWPADVVYLSAPTYSKACSPEILSALHTPPHSTCPMQIAKGPASNVRITPISNPSHPAHGQHGLHAAQHLPAGSFILAYLGHTHTKSEADPASDYDLSLDRELGMGVDATKKGNEARFINDYRGCGARGPNAEFRDVWVDVGRGQAEKRMGVFVVGAGKSGKRAVGIAKGEEILVSYGKGFWSERRREDEAGEAGSQVDTT